MQINLSESKHPSILVAGWRPSIGWVCSLALFYNYIVYELLSWALIAFNSAQIAPPRADMTQLMPLLLGMLGIAGMRSYDKLKGKDTKGIEK